VCNGCVRGARECYVTMRTDLLRRHAATQLLKYNNAKDEGCTHGGAVYIGQSSSTTLDGCHFVAS
jgi:hypothetical protein